MGDLELSLAYGLNPRTADILNGKVRAEGIDLICTHSEMHELAWRQLGYQEFQVSELSLSSLIISRAKGNDTWVGLPIFSYRRFFHTWILVRDDAGISDPSQLAGKRIGVPEYQQTAALWSRGVLRHEWGVDDKSVKWFMERLPERSHGGATGFDPKAIGIDLTYIAPDSSIGEMLATGELDATLLYIPGPNFVDRSSIEFGPGSGVSPLFPDQRAEGTRYLAKTGLLPVNHGAVIRKDVLDEHPWVAESIYHAFLAAKARAKDQTMRDLQALVDLSGLSADAAAAMRADPFPYGIVANRAELEAITQYSFEQGLTPRKLALDEVFYPPMLNL